MIERPHYYTWYWLHLSNKFRNYTQGNAKMAVMLRVAKNLVIISIDW